MMASKTMRKRRYVLPSESSDSECSIPVNRGKQLERIAVGELKLKKVRARSTDEDDNSVAKFISRKDDSVVRIARIDESAKFKSRNKEDTSRANVKPVTKSRGEYNKRVKNYTSEYNLDKDSCDSSASSDSGGQLSLKLSDGKEYNDRKNKVEVVGSRRRIDDGTSASERDTSNSVVTSSPLKENQKENKKNREAVSSIRRHIMKMTEELKYIRCKFELEVRRLRLKFVRDEIVTEQDGKDVLCTYDSMINQLKKELTVQQQILKGPYHRCGETKAHSQSSSKIFPANCKRPKVAEISKPDGKNDINKQPLEANCTSAVAVEKSNTTSNSDKSSIVESLLSRLNEISAIKIPSRTSVADPISTVHTEPNLEVLDRAYKKTVERQVTAKQDSLRNGRVKEKGTANSDSDVNSTCSTIALYPRRNGNVQINNYQGGLIHAGANKDVSSRDVAKRDVSKGDVSRTDVSKRDVSSKDVSNRDVSSKYVSNRDVSSKDVSNRDVSSKDVANRDVSSKDVANRDVSSKDIYQDSLCRFCNNIPNRDVSKSPNQSNVTSVDVEGSDEISFTDLYFSDSEDTEIISSNEIRNLKHRSEDHISAKRKTVLTSSNSENIRPKQQSEFVVPDINNLSRKYRSHHVAISNRANSVPESKPTERNQYNTRVDEKLRMNCKVVIEKFRIRRYL